MVRTLSFFLLIFSFIFYFAPLANAQTMENGYFKIQLGNIDSVSEESNESNYNLSETSDQNDPDIFEGHNYKFRLGFQSIPNSSPLSLAISETLLDFGLLTPTNPIERTITLAVSGVNPPGYSVTAAQNHELMNGSTGTTIPDTTCDDGKCTESLASEWTNTLTYGFGYRCEAEDIACVENDTSFIPKSFFKQFSNTSDNESATTIMSGGAKNSLEATILYKVNISSSQPAGAYSNEVTFLATPNY